ncbi:hypothetical protein M407DRAFT_90580 [Tulasnella calospora MUT 4182]|uniref:Uncharacterized protein n=1 Tax=Tulasnella calospora MUT 4182 TaxID=1051891 RepID=A0A0C3LG33_9AGAM|nr:hypothetical protein M407DRAFT_90580 [Tulasnella calospora MUT 4182]
MSPTAQPDVQPFQASAGAFEHIKPSNNSDSIGATTLRSKLGLTSEGSVNGPRKIVMIISISYGYWFEGGVKPMTLMSVQSDLDLTLNRYNYRHNGTQEKFLIYTDYPHEYTDSSGTRAFLPCKEASKPEILAGFSKVISSGNNVVIYYSGHCSRRGPGTSTITPKTYKDRNRRYEENGVERAGPPYIIASDAQRIYGYELYAIIKQSRVERTITMVFDTCNVGTFFENVIEFRYVYRAIDDGGSETQSRSEGNASRTQIIFVAATQFGEGAGTFLEKDTKKENGAVTLLMDEFFKARGASRSAQALVERLYSVCHTRQKPQIYSLFPIVGDFELLP